MMINNIIKGIYIHIPFCKEICYYCDFVKVYYNEKIVDEYLEALANEISNYTIDYVTIESIYIGGGTPSSLSIKQLKRLFEIIALSKFSNLKEITFEANPEQLDEEKIVFLAQNQVNRVSLGVQSFDEEILKSINRYHTKEDVYHVINLLRKHQIDNISIDLMYGFNNQSLESINNDLIEIDKLNIKHLSYYSLILEEHTVFYQNNYQIHADEFEFDNYIREQLINHYGFEHYEVSNFTKENKYSLHNLLYWDNDKYYGFGLGSCGYLNNYRYYNTKSITKYLKYDYDLKYDYYDNKMDLLKDEILLGFRKFNGLDINKINQKYSINFTFLFKSVIIKHKDKLDIKDNFLFFNEQGKLFLNDLIIDFIEEIGE